MSRNKIARKAVNTVFDRQLTKNVNLAELIVTSQPFANIPSDAEIKRLESLAINLLQPTRNLLGVPMRFTSVFRSPEVNKAVGGAANSQHLYCEAADFIPVGMSLQTAMKMIVNSNIPYDQLIIETGKNNEQWIHISWRPDNRRKQALVATWNRDKNKMEYKNYVA